MKKYCIVNAANKKLINKLEEYGYLCIPTEKSNYVSEPIDLHADVLYLKSDEKTIYVSECQKNNIELLKRIGYDIITVKLSPGYKTECKLNMIVTNDIILCNSKTCMDVSKIKGNRTIIYTNQGYTKCSTVSLDNDSFITEDKSIYESLIFGGKNCLLIEKGYVELKGYNYGFIGGASIYMKEEHKLLFLGNIKKHINYNEIETFCNNINISIDYIDMTSLTDIGGAVIL